MKAQRSYIRWHTPVHVKKGLGQSEGITGPHTALEALRNGWPSTRGRHYEAARRQCEAAIDGHVRADTARETFIAASIEANLLAR
jgi:hypothetical protein